MLTKNGPGELECQLVVVRLMETTVFRAWARTPAPERLLVIEINVPNMLGGDYYSTMESYALCLSSSISRSFL